MIEELIHSVNHFSCTLTNSFVSAPSPPILGRAIHSTLSNIYVGKRYVSAPSGEIFDDIIVSSVFPEPLTSYTTDSNSVYLTTRNLDRGARYTISIRAILGGNYSGSTDCRTAPTEPLKSEEVQFVGCTG